MKTQNEKQTTSGLRDADCSACCFCGSSDLETGDLWDMPGGYVRCKCGAMMQKIGESVDCAIAAWNNALASKDKNRLDWLIYHCTNFTTKQMIAGNLESNKIPATREAVDEEILLENDRAMPPATESDHEK